MLAPMQGLTNRAMRQVLIDWVRPDTVFTEFVRVSSVSRKRIANSDRVEAGATYGDVPLVVQLVGHDAAGLVRAAEEVARQGAQHLNLNMGCPYGRMTTGQTGGAMLKAPERLPEILAGLRETFSGTLSVKLRAGYDDPRQAFAVLPMFEAADVDFLVLHPRIVTQKYSGRADHAITAEMVKATALPIIANGDIFTAEQGLRVLEQTGAAGLMLGRGAIVDPLLFERLRSGIGVGVSRDEKVRSLAMLLQKLLPGYVDLFSGEAQVLAKLKGVLASVEDADLVGLAARMKRIKSLAAFEAEIEALLRA
ncbi:MAG: tRNA-dihydrouridine synthase family protein [Desulfuromonadales bacterium]|nr:tRNA-dihydrouridine synthase family protein [Desulfuromonadales bacterium]NIS43940.1 tRNA-dihydrouridine synthase family protein [Desulfuromonadales bacterium]